MERKKNGLLFIHSQRNLLNYLNDLNYCYYRFDSFEPKAEGRPEKWREVGEICLEHRGALLLLAAVRCGCAKTWGAPHMSWRANSSQRL